MKGSSLNFLTFDIEEWYHANYKGFDVSRYSNGRATNLPLLVDELLDLCLKYEVKATFFIVGSVAKRYPKMVRAISGAGHEIASHSFNHELVYDMTPKEFELDLIKTKKTLEDISGKRVTGFRAPSWSVNAEITDWFYKTLVKSGYSYSSSVFPAKNFLYGIDNANTSPHVVKIGNNTKSCMEIPCSVHSLLGKKVGFSGGFYLRVMPKIFALRFTRKINKQGVPVVFYLHPREIDTHQRKIALPFLESTIHYYGIKGCKSKLEFLIDNLNETLKTTMGEYVKNENI